MQFPPSCVSVGNERRFRPSVDRLGSQNFRMSSLFVKQSSTIANHFSTYHPQKQSSHLLKMKKKEFCILKQMLNSHHCRSIFSGADSNFIKFRCDCFVNVFLGDVPDSKIFIVSKKVPFGKIFALSLVFEKNETF